MGEKLQDQTDELGVVVSAEQIIAAAVEQSYLEMAIQMRRNTHVRGLEELREEQADQTA